jgi:hypothetical protein
MTGEPPNPVPVKLKEIRKELARTNENVGGLARSIVGMKREFERAHAGIQRDLGNLKGGATPLVVAVDDHTHRLDGIETRLDKIDTRLERIEKHTGLAHA